MQLYNQHCFMCHLSNSVVSEDAGNESRIVATLLLAVRRLTTLLDLIHTRLVLMYTRLDLMHIRRDLMDSRLDLMHTRLHLMHTRLDLNRTRLDLIHTRLDLVHSRLALYTQVWVYNTCNTYAAYFSALCSKSSR